MSSRLVSVLLVPAMLLVGPAPALAFGAPEEASAPAAEDEPATQPDATATEDAAADEPAPDPALDAAQALFNAGADKFDTADYAGAIEDWTEAYGLVPNVPEYGAIKAKLIANIASAQEKAYAVDREPSHLNQAKILLERYRAEIDDIYVDAAEREKEQLWVDEHIGRIDAELDALEQAEADAEARRNAALAASKGGDDKPPGRALIISGATMTGLGVAGIGLLATGLALGSGAEDISDLPTNELDARGDRYARGRLGNTLAYVGGAAGGALLVAGVALLAVGLKQRKAGKSEAAEGPTLSFTPLFDGRTTGLGVHGRF